MNASDFPGYNAGASLKRAAKHVPGLPRRIDFPGYNAGASLKLDRFLRRDQRRRPFPGYNAGASLKRREPPASRADDRFYPFPGYNAGASLKQDDAERLFVEELDALPRLQRRGLIEASPPTSR